jgi:signal transduction histidine kinase
VNSFFEDTQGNLWLGTLSGGLCYFDYKTEKFRTYTDKHGLPANNVYSLLTDNKNNLWLGTSSGLSRFDPITKTFTNYDYTDGLQSNVFVASDYTEFGKGGCIKGSDGTLYFGGNNGFNFFDPQQLKPNSQIAPVVITQFKLFDKLVKGANESKKIVLDYDENYFSFEFASLSYYNPSKNQYKYKLEGAGKDWIYSGSRRYAGYTNIDPGTYTFKVKGTNNDGIWNEEGASITIIIKPPWWQTWWAYTSYFVLVLLAIWGFIKWRTKTLQTEKKVLEKRVTERTRELKQEKEIVESTLAELKSTQAQLIQSEKMASLGELTAGIAHEIQNPLNFVNNFSEVSNELIDEMNGELDKGDIHEAKIIADDIKQNLEKINHHGRRADGIVKGMLQHSRTSSGQKEPVDINKLADEYLRLSYHGLRAKDKSFNAEIKTDFDSSIGNINVVPQDIGRVILNLINNAFYAVTERSKAELEGYKPSVTVSTKKLSEKIEISVKDNGNGVPFSIREKIFQPFFTTKPTGQGTGLGLSLAYDIVKAHGGEIKVESKEREGTSFIIQLPGHRLYDK